MKSGVVNKPPTPSVGDPWWSRTAPWFYVSVFVAVLVAYWPALSGGYIWDDAGHVTRVELRPLGGLFRIWFDLGATQQYYPVLHSAFWLESHLWGDAPVGYHLLNVLLHATAACLFAVVLCRLRIPGAPIAAMLFALHPVAVESVAWIAEQKNTLSLVFYLWAGLVYLRFDEDRRPGRYVAATLLFLLALGTKTVSATLPAALLVVFWWARGRVDGRRDVLPLLPWFGCAAIAGAVTSWVERTLIGAAGAEFHLDLVSRVLLAGRVIWFYLGKLVWPANLVFIYPRWEIDATEPWPYLFPLAAIALLIACWAWRRRGPLAAVLFFGGSLFPALGFVNVFPFIYSFVADHFQYLPDLGFWTLVGAGAALALTRLPRVAGYGALAVIAVGLGALTRQQTQMYHDVFALYETTLAKNPNAWMAHNNLAIALVDAGRAREAIPHYEAALKLRLNYPEGENNLGYALTIVGEPQAALPHLQRALQLRPNYAEAHNNCGIALMNLGRTAEGEQEFRKALELRSDYAEAHRNLGLALATAGRTTEAITQFAAAVRANPNYAPAELDWAVGLTLSDRFDEARPHFERALELTPNDPDAHNRFGRALARAGQATEAIAQFRSAIALNPNLAEAHLNLGVALRRLGRTTEAQQEFAEASRLGAGSPAER